MKNRSIFIIIFLLFFSNLYGQYNSVLANGDWYKISTVENGVHKLSYANLLDLGININNIQTQDIKLYGNGGGMLPRLNSDFRHTDLVENAIQIYDSNNNGIFESEDYILFYGQSPNKWIFNSSSGYFTYQRHLYSDEVFYFLTIDNTSPGKRIQQKTVFSNPTVTISTYNDYRIHELELENLLQSGRQWFGERLDYQSNHNFDFYFSELVQSSPIAVKTEVVARSISSSNCLVSVNENTSALINIPQVSSSFSAEYAKIASSTIEITSNSSNVNINLQYSSNDNSAMAWLNYIELNVRRKLKMTTNNAILFRDALHISPTIGKFEIEDANQVSVWDVSDPTDVSVLPTVIIGNTLSFNDSLSDIREYIAFRSSTLLSPNLLGSINNQNLHNLDSDIQYVIIAHSNFLDAANRLADFHSNHSNLNSIVVTPDEIYNEFSSGMQDVTAIRDFLKMLYDRPDSQLKYVLLFGDGSYDPKNRIPDNTNFIPTYQSFNSTSPTNTYVTDDYFGLLDDNEGLFLNDLIDIGIGRFPVSTQEEAGILVDKVEYYYSQVSFGSWRNDIVFIADDGDANDQNVHMWQADSLANIVDDNYQDLNISKIYLDNYYQESTPAGPRSQAAQDAINNKINKGALLVNYTGHGGKLGWTQERILEVDQINNWENDYLPLFMTATCKFSYFDDPEQKSAGEYVLLNEKGGAIALLSTTRLVYSSPNYNLNTKFINVLFEKEDGVFPTIGDIFRKTKVLSGSALNNRNFTLLGDPALRLAYPEYDVETTFINDTLRALSEVTIEGRIVDEIGLLSNFNGTVVVTVFDKEVIRTTLGQESCSPMPYRDQNNILYKGTASVINSEFSISFIVPKDIAYHYAQGRISYYAISNDSLVDAGGNDENFIIGGIDNNIIDDYEGPEISLYMNTRNFLDGGITDSDPTLIADIFDVSGINMVGNGIGHDITAILDGNTTIPYILNEYYQSNQDDYTRGTVSFPFSSLENGEHTITFKIWDVFNNSSEKTINFIVTDDNIFTIADYKCYPNPFTNSTEFYFQHNKSNQNLDVIIEIFSIEGRLVKTIEKEYFDNGYLIGPINWDGTNDYGEKVSQGMYIAQLYIISEDSDVAKKAVRLILLSP